MDNAGLIWEKDVPYLKRETMRNKPIQVTEDFIRVLKEVLKLNKDLFLTMDIFLVNKIPLLITLSHKIDVTDTGHFHTQTARDVFKYSWRIYVFYFKHNFKITTVYAHEEFSPVRGLIAEISS